MTSSIATYVGSRNGAEPLRVSNVAWRDEIGNGQPDPDVAFAEGQFYLATQHKTDYFGNAKCGASRVSFLMGASNIKASHNQYDNPTLGHVLREAGCRA